MDPTCSAIVSLVKMNVMKMSWSLVKMNVMKMNWSLVKMNVLPGLLYCTHCCTQGCICLFHFLVLKKKFRN